METVQILIPDESFDLVESTDSEGAKALMVINATLKQHKDDIPLKQVFNYYCSVIFDYNDVDDNLWPTPEEFSTMRDYVETFDKAIKVNDEHPNALFVARVTHKGTCQMIWMLHDAQTTIEYLDGVSLKVIKYESLSITLKVILNGVALSGSYRTSLRRSRNRRLSTWMYLVSLAGLIKNSKFVRSLNCRPYSRHTGWNATL